MGRGNLGASTSLTVLELQDDSQERKREKWKERRVEGRQKDRSCFSLWLKGEQAERRERSQEQTGHRDVRQKDIWLKGFSFAWCGDEASARGSECFAVLLVVLLTLTRSCWEECLPQYQVHFNFTTTHTCQLLLFSHRNQSLTKDFDTLGYNYCSFDKHDMRLWLTWECMSEGSPLSSGVYDCADSVFVWIYASFPNC